MKSLLRHGMSLAAAACVALISASASAQAPKPAPGVATPPPPKAVSGATTATGDDIVATAKKAGSFGTLLTALEKAGLDGLLKGKGPFTVFAPSDAAFAKVPKEQLDLLLDPKNKRWLDQTLRSHVLVGKTLTSARIGEAKKFNVKMANGSNVLIDTKNGPTFGGAAISKADIKASNGLIHVIDDVYLPKRVRAALFAKGTYAKAKKAAGPALEKSKDAAVNAYEKAKESAQKAYDKAKAALEKATADYEKSKAQKQ
jgi:uncharacterized surface protein with fasciclin (FAS1) repeats